MTATRRAENAQVVPVSITAISAKTMATQGIQNTDDLQRLVPGVIFSGSGSLSDTTYTIRGQSRSTAGSSQNSVITYFNEVPLAPIGSYTPLFDMDNVQVLKGPQGTLFGRNTTGGAVLVYSKTPTDNFGGYLQMDLGSYNEHSFQGAINIPIVPDKLIVRVAADIERRDGYTYDYTTGQHLDNVNSNAVRVSVLAQPTNNIRNVLIFDYLKSDIDGPGFIPYSVVNPQLAPLVAEIDAMGSRTNGTTIRPYDHEVESGVSNTTTINFGNTTFKNIFGYRYFKVADAYDDTGLPAAPLPNLGPAIAALGYVPGEPGTLVTTYNDTETSQFSDEVQFSGKLFHDKLAWIAGAFYVDMEPAGPYWLDLDIFRPTPPTALTSSIVNSQLGGVWPVGSVSNTMYGDESAAGYADLTYDLSGVSPWLKGFKISAGLRYTADTESICSNSFASVSLATGMSLAQPYASVAQCKGDKGSAYAGPSFDASAPFHALTYSFALDYALNDNVFLYFTTRSGYRAGGLNSPNLAPILAEFQTYKPQTIVDYEIGTHIKWRVGNWSGRFNIDAFTDAINGLQLSASGITVASGLPGLTASNEPSNGTLEVNAATATARGVEFDGEVSPIRGLVVSFGGAYLDEYYNKLTAPNILVPYVNLATFQGAPQWSLDGSIQYILPLDPAIGRIGLNANVYYIDKQYEASAPLPAYTITNFNINWQRIYGSHFDLTLYVDNALNALYIQNVQLGIPTFGVYTGVEAPPRMFGARLRYNF